MFDPSLSSASIQNLITLKWREKRTAFHMPDEHEPHAKTETLTQNLNQQEVNSEPSTLGHLDTMDSISATVKTIKGILKSPKDSLVLRSSTQCETTRKNQTSQSTRNNQQSSPCSKRKGTPLVRENLNESKRKKVTFSTETKNTEARRSHRCVIVKKKAMQNNSDSETLKFESSLGNNLTLRAEIAAHSSPRNMFKITKKTSNAEKSSRCSFNVNASHQQANHLDDLEDHQKDNLKIPRFAKSLSSDTQSHSSLQIMLEESSIYPNPNSPQIGPFSARNDTLKTSYNNYFHDIRSPDSLTPRDDRFFFKAKREESVDYYAELQKKASLILQNVSSPSESKAKTRPILQTEVQSDTFIIRKRYFIKPMVNAHERP